MFVAGALKHERPFLGPLFKFISTHPRDAVRKILPYVKFILRYLSSEIKKQRHYSCSTRLVTADCSPRVDAQASASRTGIGGWFPVADEKGDRNPWLSNWFSLEIKKDDFSWIFEKGNCPSLVISTLEALAILVALKFRPVERPEEDEKRVLMVPSITDNHRNGAALNKLMSTRFPSSTVLMDLATYLKVRGLRGRFWNGNRGSSTRKQTNSRTELLTHLIQRNVFMFQPVHFLGIFFQRRQMQGERG